MSASVPGTARDTLHDLALLISSHGLSGQPSRELVYGLQLSAEIAGELPLFVADIATGLMLVVQPRAADEAPDVTARRRICAALSELIGPTAPGTPARLAAVLRAIERSLFGSADPNEAAIAAAARSTAVELESASGHDTITGTLTYRHDRSDWLLQLVQDTLVITGPPPPTNGDGWAIAEQLMPIVRPHVEGLLSGPTLLIRVVDPTGRDIVGQRPPGGVDLASLYSRAGDLCASVPRSGPPIS